MTRKARHKVEARNHPIDLVTRADQQDNAASGTGRLTTFVPPVNRRVAGSNPARGASLKTNQISSLETSRSRSCTMILTIRAWRPEEPYWTICATTVRRSLLKIVCLKKHAWKLLPLARADAHQILPTHFRSTTSRNNGLRQRVPVNDGVAPGFRGVCDTVLTQFADSLAPVHLGVLPYASMRAGCN